MIAARAAIDALFRPASVAVVGASADPSKLNGRPIGYLQRAGFAGEIYPVNPRYDAIGDLTCYADAVDLPAAPDAALVLVGAERSVEAVAGLASIGTKCAIVLASGFGETDDEGAALESALKEAAGDMRLVGPNTVGAVNLIDGVMLSASGAMDMADFPAGRVAVISQSGGILGALLSRGVGRGCGFSHLVATGNETDLEVAEFLDWVADDPATDVAALYLETLRDVDAFRAAAERVTAAGKRIVAYKVGRSEAGARAAISHTGALAGATEVYDALFDRLGIVRAESFADLVDLPVALATGRRLAGKRVAVLTSTGGAATLVADNLGLAGFDVPPPDPATAEKLIAMSPPGAALDRNPIDVTLAGLRPELLQDIIGLLAGSASYDGIVVVVGSSAIGRPEVFSEPLAAALGMTDKPVVAYVSPDGPDIVRHLTATGIPAFAAPEAVASAMRALLPIEGRTFAEPRATPTVDLSGLPSGTLNEVDSRKVFARFGISGPAEAVCATPSEAAEAARAFDGPVVLKVLSPDLAHKSDVGGVAVGIPPDDVERVATDMLARVTAAQGANDIKIDGLLVQEQIVGGVELILGLRRDPQLGSYILLGSGGVATELHKDATVEILPLNQSDTRAMIGRLAAAPLLTGYRGRPPADIDALVEAILGISGLAAALGDRLVEAEINPLFVLPAGEGVRAADGLVVLA